MSGSIYIAGPMTGLPENNYPAFHRAAAELRAFGWFVVNPAENTPPNAAPTWDDWMRISREQVRAAALVVVLPGWERSEGACEEVEIANSLGISVYTLREALTGESDR